MIIRVGNLCFCIVLMFCLSDCRRSNSPIVECVSWKSLVTNAMMTASISYLSDHPRNGRKAIDPRSITPFTPTQLFKVYYGAEASAYGFESSILDLVYCIPSLSAKEDRIRMRSDINRLAKAGNSQLARKKMGTLLFSITEELSGIGTEWRKDNCLPIEISKDSYNAISVEFARLRNEVGEVMFERFLGVGIGSTLAFVIDDTGSMGTEIKAAKQRAKLVINHLQNTLDLPLDFLLVPFNDPSVGPLTVTTDSKVFMEALENLQPYGGGDFAEMSLGGIQLAIEASRSGSTLYVITDVEAKDYTSQDSVIAEARRKHIVVTFLLTRPLASCSNTSSRDYKTCMELYRHIAKETGGFAFVVPREGIFKATKIIQSGIKQGLVVIKKQTIIKAAQEEIVFAVDRSISEVIVEAQGNCGLIDITNNNNHSIATVEGIGDLYSTSVAVNGSFGYWKMLLSRRTLACKVKILAKSTLGFLLTVKKKKNRKSKEYEILNGNPSPSDSLSFLLDGYGLENIAFNDNGQIFTVCFLNEFGDNSILPVKVKGETGRETLQVFLHKGIGFKQPFYIVIKGEDNQGQVFSRVISRLIATTHIDVDCDLSEVTFQPGVSTTANVTVRNSGNDDTFFLSVWDTKGFASGKSTTKQIILRNQEKVFQIRIFSPKKAKPGESTSITVAARGSQYNSFQFDVCAAIVGQKKGTRIDSLSIKGIINSRFAETVVTQVVKNNAGLGREAEFRVLLPSDAFIVNITMKLENEMVIGKIYKKNDLKEAYYKTKKNKKNMGHVTARDITTKVHRTSLFVKPRQNVTFQLTYQQLLGRTRGDYKYALMINPEQPIKKLMVDVYIVENEPLSFVRVPPFLTEQRSRLSSSEPRGTTIIHSRDRKSSHVRYAPSIAQQTEFSPFGLSGTFQISYDVERTQIYGDTTYANGYFAHFFAPSSLPSLPKIVIYIIDISASMFGHKMTQLIEAVTLLLRGLNKHDYFNLVLFNDNAVPWIRFVMAPATPASIDDAIQILNHTQPIGGTNMQAAFEASFDIMRPFLPKLLPDDSTSPAPPIDHPADPLIERYSRIRRMAAVTRADVENYAKLMVFVTDGSASLGETDADTLIAKINQLNRKRASIHTLGIGPMVDMKLLGTIAAQNGGISRRVFETFDTSTQIEDFFEEVTNPLMTDISVRYADESVQETINNNFNVFAAGSELVVAGKTKTYDDLWARNPRQIRGRVNGRTFENEIKLDFNFDLTSSSHITTSEHQIQNLTEHLWAFLKVKDLLRRVAMFSDKSIKSQVVEQVINTSLKYNFVTPFTSLVVIHSKDRKLSEKDLKQETQDLERDTAKEENSKLEIKNEKKISNASGSNFATEHSFSEKDSSDYIGGFYGDPHFVIPLREDLNLCFNWNGKGGEIYNLIYDPSTGTTINGQLISSSPSDSVKDYRTYISKLSIIIPSKHFKLLISPDKITILRRGAQSFSLPVKSRMTFSRSGIKLSVYEAKRGSARLKVVMQGVMYKVIMNRNIRHSHRTDHLDFSVNGNNRNQLDTKMTGVIGQFLNSNATLIDGKSANHKIIKINDRSGHVVQFERQQPGTKKRLSCWHSHNSALDLIQGTHDHYLVDDILSFPTFMVQDIEY